MQASAMYVHNKCDEYAKQHDIKFNTKKSVVLIRRNNLLRNASVPSFKLCGESLTEVKETKYLGHIITSDGKDTKDISKGMQPAVCSGEFSNKIIPYVL